MIDSAKVLALLIGGVLTDNFVFSRYFVERSALGEKKLAAAALIGAVVALIVAVSSIAISALYFFVLTPLKLTYLGTVAFVLVIAGVFWLADFLLRSKNPLRFQEPTTLHALIAVNSVLVGAALLSAQTDSFLVGALTGVFGGAGFLLAVVLMAGVRERIALSDVPEGLKGLPIGLISAGLIALAFLGFSGFGG
jgi:Na+-translocating ferredoxin:NAD+ oxidoreductase subunit A